MRASRPEQLSQSDLHVWQRGWPNNAFAVSSFVYLPANGITHGIDSSCKQFIQIDGDAGECRGLFHTIAVNGFIV